jgi:pimeloyl-ACP methyl ester carboxylesterase
MVGRILGGLVALVLVAFIALFAMWGALDKSTEELLPQYASDASQFVTLPSGASVHFRDEGNGNGPVLLLVHGSNASLHTWEPWVQILSDDYRVITLDLPGHGLTGTHSSDDYTRIGQVRFVKELVDHLGLTDFVMGGNSMGGGVTLQYAVTHGDDLKGIIPVSSSGMPRNVDNSSPPLAFRLAATPVVNQLMLFITPRSIVEDGLKHSIEDDGLVTEAMIDRYFDMTLHDGNRGATRARFQGYANRGVADAALAEQVPNIDLPALIIWGANDPLIPVESAHKMKEALPQAKLVIYENVGHIAMEEVPGESAAEVRAFLASVNLVPQAAPAPPAVLCGGAPAAAEGVPVPEPFNCGG